MHYVYLYIVCLVLKKLLIHCTGSSYPHPNSIRVDFVEEDVYGTITAHTCDRVITFPKGVFTESEESSILFKSSFLAVIGVDTFNTV